VALQVNPATAAALTEQRHIEAHQTAYEARILAESSDGVVWRGGVRGRPLIQLLPFMAR